MLCYVFTYLLTYLLTYLIQINGIREFEVVPYSKTFLFWK